MQFRLLDLFCTGMRCRSPLRLHHVASDRWRVKVLYRRSLVSSGRDRIHLLLRRGGAGGVHGPGRKKRTRVIDVLLTRTYIRKLKYRFVFWSVLGQFPAEIEPGTVTTASA